MPRKSAPATAAFGANGNGRSRTTAEDVVTALRRSGLQLSCDLDGNPYIAFRGDKFMRRRLGSTDAAHLIRHIYKLHMRNTASENPAWDSPNEVVLARNVVDNVVAHLAAEATTECEKTEHFLRVCWRRGACCIDLGQDSYATSLVTAKGFWPSIADPRIPFVRHQHMREMPTPTKMPGVMDELRALFPTLSEDGFKLVVLFMLSCLWPSGPWAVLVISGLDGSFKTTLEELIRQVVDPHGLRVADMPEDPRDMATAGHNARLLIWDNVSALTKEQSDALCRRSDGSSIPYMTRTRILS